MKDRYAIVGPLYDFISTVYSGNSIQHCKVAHLDQLKPGDKVLFAGVGHGRDALYAAQRGAEVTVVDLSQTMLSNFSGILEKDGRCQLFPQRVSARNDGKSVSAPHYPGQARSANCGG